MKNIILLRKTIKILDLDNKLLDKEINEEYRYRIKRNTDEYKTYVEACKLIGKQEPTEFDDITLNVARKDVKEAIDEITFKISTKGFAKFMCLLAYARGKGTVSLKDSYKYTLFSVRKSLEDLKKEYEKSDSIKYTSRIPALEDRINALEEYISKKGYEFSEEDAKQMYDQLDKMIYKDDDMQGDSSPENV